jgi:PLP dependent protein
MSYRDLLAEVAPYGATLIAVSKKRPIEAIQRLYDQGCRHFGENRLDEALEKQTQLPTDIKWHFIGTLQRKKAAKAIGHFSLIHSVDSLELAQKISSSSADRTTRILLQVNTSGEASKQGFTPATATAHFTQILSLPNLQVDGLMTMAPLTDDTKLIRTTFRSLRLLRDRLQQLSGDPLPHLSMGMSSDYRLALDEGATLLRIGSAIFGE